MRVVHQISLLLHFPRWDPNCRSDIKASSKSLGSVLGSPLVLGSPFSNMCLFIVPLAFNFVDHFFLPHHPQLHPITGHWKRLSSTTFIAPGLRPTIPTVCPQTHLVAQENIGHRRRIKLSILWFGIALSTRSDPLIYLSNHLAWVLGWLKPYPRLNLSSLERIRRDATPWKSGPGFATPLLEKFNQSMMFVVAKSIPK